MSKNILICLDGTKNEVKAKAVTNVFKIAEVADLENPEEQVLYYDPGVGTKPAASAFTAFCSAAWRWDGGCETTSARPTPIS